MITTVKDKFGREISYLRISITQRCNLNCVYCGKEDCAKKASELPPEAYYKIAKAFAKKGIKKLRITGGEPLVRNDVAQIIKLIRSSPEIQTIALTTNGVYLKKYAKSLKEAGLDSVNISLDSTDDSTYRHLTGADVFYKVMEGIELAEEVGLAPIKINAVLMKGVNSDGAEELVSLARNKKIDVRFIELMPFSDDADNEKLLITGDEILEQFPFLEPVESEEGAAKYYSGAGFKGRVGLISPVSHKFCDECNRIRLLCDGKIKPCLGYDDTFDIEPYINDEEKLIEKLENIILKKPAGHHFENKNISHGLNRTGG